MSLRDVYGRESVAAPTAAEAVALDRDARERERVPGRLLMENAGRAAALVLERLYPRGRVVAAIGSGNNGGDALVLLRTLRSWGREVAFVRAGGRGPDAELRHGFQVPELSADDVGRGFAEADLIVDGILGTGASGAPRPETARTIEAMRLAGRPIIALDAPTGVDPTTGEVPGAVVRADVTVTFGWPKLGLLLFPGRACCGRIVAVEIGFPPLGADRVPGAALITSEWAASRIPAREPDAYKGSAGRVLIVAGSRGMAGAAAAAARAAIRAGAGYVRLASPVAVRETLQTLVPEAVFVDRDDPAALDAAADASDAVVIGPGLGLDDDAHAAVTRLLDSAGEHAVLLDADALTILAGDPERLGAISAISGKHAVVLTPHPGEMERLSGRPAAEIVTDPVESARALAERTGAAVLLKGAPSVVAAPGMPVLVNTVGSSDAAKAGMGDQLAGTVGALLAQGRWGGEAVERARTGAALGLYLAGRAADLAGRGRALTPDEVSEHLDAAFRLPGPSGSDLGLPFVTFDQPDRW